MNNKEYTRYQRQIRKDIISMDQQIQLADKRVLVIGAGGLGTPAILYLAAMGVGTIGVADFDCIEITNLNRQILYTPNEIGEKKVKVLAEKVREFNPGITVLTYDYPMEESNILEVIKEYEVIVDATDNIKTRYLLNDACCRSKKILIEGAVERLWGNVFTIVPGSNLCYRCLYPDQEDNIMEEESYEKGVLGAVPGIIGSMQALEAVRVLLSLGKNLSGRLLQFDGYEFIWREVKIKKRIPCSSCMVNNWEVADV